MNFVLAFVVGAAFFWVNGIYEITGVDPYIAEVMAAGPAYSASLHWCIAQCRDLLSHGVPAIHFYTMTKARNIIEILRACF